MQNNKPVKSKNELDDSGNVLFNLIKKLFRAIFGGGSSFEEPNNASPAELSKNINEINSALSKYRDDNLKNGNFLNAYIAENQRIGFSAIQSQANNINSGISANDISRIAMNNINEKLKELNCSDIVLSEFQDYKNHDIERINGTIGEVNSLIKEKIDKNAWPDVNTINGIMSSLNDKASSFLTTPPLSPNEKNIIDGQSYEQEMGFNTENKVENRNEYENNGFDFK